MSSNRTSDLMCCCAPHSGTMCFCALHDGRLTVMHIHAHLSHQHCSSGDHHTSRVGIPCDCRQQDSQSLSTCTAGRKRTLGVACAVTALTGMCSALAPSFWWYLIFRVFTGATVAGIMSASFLLSTEPVGPSYRGIAILSTGVCSTLINVVMSARTLHGH